MDLKQAIGEIRDELRSFLTDNLDPIRKQLLSLQERDTTVSDDKVSDLEKRIDEMLAENGQVFVLDGRIKKMDEELRLLAIPATPHSTIESLNEELDGKIVKHFLGGTYKELHAIMQQHGGLPHPGQTLAIDSALFPAGEMPPEVLSRFLDYVVQQQVFLGVVVRRTMRANTANLDRFDVADRSMVLATEGVAGVAADAITTGRRALTVVETIWPEDITLTFLEDNIEGLGAEQHIAELLARAFGNELNDLYVNGDGTTAGFRIINEGIIELTLNDGDVSDGTNIVDPAPFDAITMFNATLTTLPAEFRANPSNRFFCSPAIAQAYGDQVANRATPGGDNVLVNGFPFMRYFGFPIMADTHWDKDAAAGAGVIILLPVNDCVFGIHRDVRTDSEWQPRSRVVEYTITSRHDLNYGWGGVIARQTFSAA